jgi:hypothetical protein
VILEDSSSIALLDELAEAWRGCGGNQSHTAAGVKLHTRCELKRGRLEGPKLTDGRTSDHASPFNEQQGVPVEGVAPQRVGQLKELHVLVGATARLPMRLLLLRVPKKIADKRREDLLADAQRRQQPVSLRDLAPGRLDLLAHRCVGPTLAL